MPSKRTHDVVATIGEYTTQSGEKKKRYVTCGSAFTDEQGRLSIKLDAVPVTPEWSGWLSLFEPRQQVHAEQRQVARPQTQTRKRTPEPTSEPNQGEPMEESDIPF